MVQVKKYVMVAGVLSLGAILSGCNQSLNSIAPNAPPRALPSAPAQPVEAGQLPPIGSAQPPLENQQVASAPATPGNQPLTPGADAIPGAPGEGGPTSSSINVTREGMAGSWQVPTDNVDCRIILAFTKWAGGYRAATRRCNSLEIQTVNAWDVKDQSVVLVDQAGNEVARLFGNQSGRYDGRTKSGEAISFVR